MSKKFKREKGGNVNIAENIYEASATFGKIVSYFQLFAGLIIGVILLLLGVYLLRSKELKGKGSAIVTATSCDKSDVDLNKTCTATVQFTAADGKQYSSIITGIYTIGQEVAVNYDPNHPATVNKSLSTRNIGIVLLVVGSLIIIAASVWFYLVQKYKVAAAATGIGEAGNIITSPFINN